MVTKRVGATRYQPRKYESDEVDLPKLQRFVAEAWRAVAPEFWEMHQGDLLWARYMLEDATGRWFDRVRLWEISPHPQPPPHPWPSPTRKGSLPAGRGGFRSGGVREQLSDGQGEGELAGFSVFYPKAAELALFVRPDLQTDLELIEGMVREGAALARKEAIEGEPPPVVSAWEGDPLYASLERLGLKPSEDPAMRINRRSLDELPEVVLPEGWQVRALRGPEEYEQRVEIHREAFQPSRLTVAAYERLRSVPGYDRELDLVCVSPEGVFASYAIAWYDPETRIGEFEPVGAREAFRGRGLTKAVMAEGMRRLKAKGATAALVSNFSANAAATGLYESMGFRERHRWVFFPIR